MPKPVKVEQGKGGRWFVRLDNGQTRFIKKQDIEEWQAAIDAGHELPTRSESTTLQMRTRPELDFSPHDLAWIARGFFERARGVRCDPASLFDPDHREIDDREVHRQLLELGAELWDITPAAVAHFRITKGDWASLYDSFASSCWIQPHKAGQGAEPVVRPPQKTQTPHLSGSGPRAWLPPVTGRVTSPFATQREGGRHEGVDIAVPVGTTVRAPRDMKITEVGRGERAGQFVVAEVERVDGSFDGDGYRMTFAHLSGINVVEDQVVQQGAPIGQSGATGNASGPHLHWRVEWVEKGLFSDDRTPLDPLSLVPQQVVEGQAQPQVPQGGKATALKNGQPINIVIAPGAEKVSQGDGVHAPDVKVQLPLNLGGDEAASYTPHRRRGGEPNVRPEAAPRFVHVVHPAADNDPMSDFLDDAVDVARTTVATVLSPEAIKAAGGLVAAGAGITGVVGTLAGQPAVAAVAAPIGAAGAAVAGIADPMADFLDDDEPVSGSAGVAHTAPGSAGGDLKLI